MTQQMDVSQLPRNTQGSFRELAQLLTRLAGDNLQSLSAFGGWLYEDPLYEGTPARSVAVLQRHDLRLLDQLGNEGVRFGDRGVAAPLIMTPSYIAASQDVFPLELLEIQQTLHVVHGPNAFAELEFQKADIRLQCERELKSQLIHLRQGLIAAAGDHGQLGPLCRAGADRIMRVLRGVLVLKGLDVPRQSAEVLERAGGVIDVKLSALAGLVQRRGGVGFSAFASFYDDIASLTEYVDQMGNEG